MANPESAWRSWWTDLAVRDRWVVAGIAGGILVAAVVALFFAFRSPKVALFSNLEPGEATAIANQLALDGVPNEVDEAGGRILVPEDQVHAARIRVMERGIPIKGPVGFELFNNVEFGVTDFAQRVNYQRALEGEITRTILALDEVDQVRLHLVMPEPGLFRRNEEGPKASLTVGIKPSTTLAPGKVVALQRLVAAAVPGLKPEAVSVIDLNGDSLSVAHVGGADDDSTVSVAAGIESRRSLEEYLTKKAQAALDAAVGKGAASVLINVELEHGQRQRRRETVLPVGSGITGAVSSMRSWGARTSAEEMVENAITHGGELPPQRSGGRDLGTEVHYEVGREVEELRSGGAQIKRVTASAIVPADLGEEVLTTLEAIVGSAVGIDVSRGDVVVVHRAPAHLRPPQAASPTTTTGPMTQEAPTTWWVRVLSIDRGVIGPALVLISLLLFWAAVRPRSKASAMSAAERRALLTDIRIWLSEPPSTKDGRRNG